MNPAGGVWCCRVSPVRTDIANVGVVHELTLRRSSDVANRQLCQQDVSDRLSFLFPLQKTRQSSLVAYLVILRDNSSHHLINCL